MVLYKKTPKISNSRVLIHNSVRIIFLICDDLQDKQNLNRPRQDIAEQLGFKATNTSKISNKISTPDLKIVNKDTLRFNTFPHCVMKISVTAKKIPLGYVYF